MVFQKKITLKMDEEQILEIIHIIQHVFLISIFCFIIASFIDKIFPILNTEKKDSVIFLEVITHLIILLIAIYYVRILIYKIPLLPFGNEDILKNNSKEHFHVELLISIILIGTQQRLIHKIDYLGKKIFKIYGLNLDEIDSSGDKKESIISF